MKLKAAEDLLKTSMITLTAANDIINTLVTGASDLDNVKGTTTPVTMIGNGHEPSGGSHRDHISGNSLGDNYKPTNGLNGAFYSDHDPNTETKIDKTSTGSRRTGSIVDNRDLTPFESIFGEIVPVPERGQIQTPITKRHLGEKDFVKSGKNSLQPNTKDKDIFSHPVDFPHQAEPYPHLTGNGKSPGMMPPPPPIDMRAFPGSMMSQFESPVPPQHSMPMGGPNPGFNPGQFAGGPGPALNRGFMSQGGPRGFMTG
ncbi:uncharacterized protein LOC117315048 [Pecten maximus]|uniref:uncharacterized protein LOC117315048 n=1 Tax=Pecten maximus TaxID=6579 RepID=UPI001458DD7F|nr:uncharacterized protein LOC117315048 [Pecten maximus]